MFDYSHAIVRSPAASVVAGLRAEDGPDPDFEALCAEQNWEMPAVIFCTGYEPTPKVREIIAKDPRHCLLSKPVSNDILLETIKAHLPK